MSNRLIVRLNPQDKTQLEWLTLESGIIKEAEPEQGSFEQLSSVAKGNRVVFLIAGDQLLLTDIKLPEGSQRNLATALPYALEDRLAEDVDKLHFVAASRQSDGFTPVAIIQRQKLADLLNEFAAAGIYPQWVLPEPLALPLNSNSWSLSFEGERIVVRTGIFSGFECTSELLSILLTHIRKEQNPEKTTGQGGESSQVLDIYGVICDPSQVASLATEGFTLNMSTGSGLPLFTSIDCKRPGLNLLQGFTDRELLGGQRENWWPASILMVMALIIHMGTTGYQYWMLYQKETEMQAQIMTLFKEAFPEVKRVVDPLQQATQLLDQRKSNYGKGEDDLLHLLYSAGQALQKSSELEFQAIEFREGVLLIRMRGNSVESIEQFKQKVGSTDSIAVEILSTVVRGDNVEAKIKIERLTS
ncbi:type II secretion system protein GspL [Sedimenticola hydrogenitrophicus]|uniref:type II secretion system protein GspL n=1 Tax=Sedimenticola hydrogenitrophicus TaxID=2967975 RepID=UPI0023AEE665|nr:type II secretion system protein GspL [Sedimenticola hydrogenitrophicus]